jgi:hypothetical protein
LVQKVGAVLLAVLVMFSVGYLLATTVLFLYLCFRGEASSPVGEGAAPDTASPDASPSAGASVESTGQDNDLSIASARWEGEKVVVEGTRRGDISSVHCDLLRGDASGSTTDWWDRTVGTRMDWSARAFTQEFVEAGGRKIRDPIDP